MTEPTEPAKTPSKTRKQNLVYGAKFKSEAESGFAKHAARLGLPGDCLGKTIKIDGVDFKVLGLRRRIRSFPVIVEGVIDQRVHVVSVEDLKASLETSAAS